MGWRCFFFPRTPRGVRLEFYSLGFSSLYFNPRTPCVVRPRERSKSITRFTFQSTHPVWGATKNIVIVFHATEISIPPSLVGCALHGIVGAISWKHISIHAPRVGCDKLRGLSYNKCHISIHAPRVGCDQGGAVMLDKQLISIHAPRVGCDVKYRVVFSPSGHFNPRTPCGVRLHTLQSSIPSSRFQSTHPVWGATYRLEDWRRAQFISIHAPRVGCDWD